MVHMEVRCPGWQRMTEPGSGGKPQSPAGVEKWAPETEQCPLGLPSATSLGPVRWEGCGKAGQPSLLKKRPESQGSVKGFVALLCRLSNFPKAEEVGQRAWLSQSDGTVSFFTR